MFLGSCHRVRTYAEHYKALKVLQLLKQTKQHWNYSPPVQECCLCATKHSWGFPQYQWLSWQLLVKLQKCQTPWKACPPSKSVWSASTSLHKSAHSTGSRTQSRRSHHLCLCSRTSFHWSPQRWTHQNLSACDRNVTLNPEAFRVKWRFIAAKDQQIKMKSDLWSKCECCSPTAMPGSELAVWTNSLPWCLTTQLGSIWVVPLGSKWTIWNFLKSVAVMALFSGHTSRISGILSLSKSSLQASPLPSPIKIKQISLI